MELLLLLSALLASLTGNGPAARDVRQVQGVAVVHAAQAQQAAVQPARQALPLAISPQSHVSERASLPLAKSAPLAGQHFPFERRLE